MNSDNDGFDPYEAPKSQEFRKEESIYCGNPFENAVSKAWSASSGSRGILFFSSAIYWTVVLIGFVFFSGAEEAGEFTDAQAIFFVAFIFGSFAGGRFLSLMLTQAYLRILRQQMVSFGRILPSPSVFARSIILPYGVAIATLGSLFAILFMVDETNEALYDSVAVSLMLILPIPVAVLGWAANPYWIDQDASFLEGLKSGSHLLFRHFGVLVTLAILGLILCGSLFCWFGWFFFDVLNVGAFTAAYNKREQAENAYLSDEESEIYFGRSETVKYPDTHFEHL